MKKSKDPGSNPGGAIIGIVANLGKRLTEAQKNAGASPADSIQREYTVVANLTDSRPVDLSASLSIPIIACVFQEYGYLPVQQKTRVQIPVRALIIASVS